MVELFANSGDSDQTLCSVASDLGLQCLSITLLGVSRLQWFNTVKFNTVNHIDEQVLFALNCSITEPLIHAIYSQTSMA